MPLTSNTCDFHTTPFKPRGKEEFFWCSGRAVTDMWSLHTAKWQVDVGSDVWGFQEEKTQAPARELVFQTPGLCTPTKSDSQDSSGKTQKPEINRITHRERIHTEIHNIYIFKFLFCEMAWERLAYRFLGELGIAHMSLSITSCWASNLTST